MKINRTNHRVRPCLLAMAAALLITGMAAPSLAGDVEIKVSIRGHRFYPDVIEVPAGQKVRLLVTNEDAEAEEFESAQMNREKIVRAGRTITIILPVLAPGEYSFIGEFHPDTAHGKVIAR